MKSQWQQFQEQQQQQRMKQAAWLEQQKRQQQQMAEQAGAQAKREVDQRFSQAEQETARQRQKFAAGKLSQEALEAKLHELMVQDAGGTWWMVGSEGGRWYRHDGNNWVPGTPPGRGVGAVNPAAGFAPVSVRSGNKVKAFFIFVFGLIITAMLFFAAGSGSYNFISTIDDDLAEPASYLIAGGVALIGLIITWRKARGVAPGY